MLNFHNNMFTQAYHLQHCLYISPTPPETKVHFVHNNYSWKRLTMLLSKSDEMQMNEATGQT